MKAVTIRQPWASAIILGPKRVENRTWVPSDVRAGRPLWLAVHAGIVEPDMKRVYEGRTGWNRLREAWPEAPAGGWVQGAFIGAMLVEGAVRVEDLEDYGVNPWATGPWCWKITQVLDISPVPFGGRLGIWDVPEAVAGLLRASWREKRHEQN